ncbi:MAG: hypothetical protein ACE5JU_25105 [Candidatus Binatia bacterium]
MAKATKSKKKPIDQYDHKGKTRVNNPPVGLVTPETDKETGKKKYAYDPHIDPSLQFDSQRSQVEKIIENGLSAETVEEVKTVLQELKKRQVPYLNWAGNAERTSFEVPTVSLHVHERIDPRTIIEAVRRRNGRRISRCPCFNLLERILRPAKPSSSISISTTGQTVCYPEGRPTIRAISPPPRKALRDKTIYVDM